MYLQNISGVFVYFPGRGARRVERPAARLGPLARVPRVAGARGAVQAGLFWLLFVANACAGEHGVD